ncbi:hypothetical protein [Sphaerisporangium sp. TRM90804]|uniref:5'-methylthioadenosine/S-adenosylhomocysteine nucleosidase family protein n=1 Tax=Sphaerisporangium sp. TRM90804 TaxID=3031113 RepID=UPI00244A9542|nr:hypothetical protein [Sphaerisporangium sp. TRM90804]MDH2426409.1 hypothetical protein [Sphaerisporangium sp. TRM90804]
MALSFRAAREMAKQVHAADNRRTVIDTLRPRGTFGLIRSRGPVTLALYVAASENRLVGRAPDGFAVLEAPRFPKEARFAGPSARIARLVYQQWELVLFGAPPAAMLLVCAMSVPFGLVWHGLWPVLVWPVLVLVLAAMAHVVVLMVLMLGTPLVRWLLRRLGRGRPLDPITSELRYLQWSMPLCHCPDPAAVPALMSRVTVRLRDLVRLQVARRVSDFSVRADTVAEPLLCLLGGVTTSAAQAAVASVTADPTGVGISGVTLLATGPQAALRRPKPVESGSVLALYALGASMVLAVIATVIPGWEREVCASNCAGRPVTFGTALRWLAWRLFAQDPPDIVPVSTWTWVFGWMVPFLGLTGVLLAVVTARLVMAAYKERMASIRKGLDGMLDPTTVLIMVATPVEREAVVTALTAVADGTPQRLNLRHHTVFDLGVVSKARVLMAQTRPGTVAPGAAMLTAKSLIEQLRPSYLLLTGICYGLAKDEDRRSADPEWDGLRLGRQRIGDIMVSSQIRAIDHRKVTQSDSGERVEILRGDMVTPSVTLLDRCENARLVPGDGPPVHIGLMLSGNILVDSPAERQRLIDLEPDAIGGEMEGAGLYAAAAKDKTDWIVVKAICDWGMRKADNHQTLAAGNAAAFVRDVLLTGGLDRPPGR